MPAHPAAFVAPLPFPRAMAFLLEIADAVGRGDELSSSQAPTALPTFRMAPPRCSAAGTDLLVLLHSRRRAWMFVCVCWPGWPVPARRAILMSGLEGQTLALVATGEQGGSTAEGRGSSRPITLYSIGVPTFSTSHAHLLDLVLRACGNGRLWGTCRPC